MCCLKTIEHLATNIDLQDDSNNVHFSIIKHLFQRLFEVKWLENLDDLLLPNHQIKIEKQDIGFNVEKSILCLPETSQIVCHAQGGRGYCLGRCVFATGGIYQWKFKILRCVVGIQIRNMKLVFNIYGTWRCVMFEKLMMKIYDFFYSAKLFSSV